MGKANQAVSVDRFDLVVSLRYISQAIVVGAIFLIVIIALLYWFWNRAGLYDPGYRLQSGNGESTGNQYE